MKITPKESWTWAYSPVKAGDGQEFYYLGIYLTLDNGKRYFFVSYFREKHLCVFPQNNTAFTILDIQLLNDFMEGLSAVGVLDESYSDNVSNNMTLALNAVACTRFVSKPKAAVRNLFDHYTGDDFVLRRGMVVSLYFAADKRVLDFINLSTPEEALEQGSYTLMFINKEFVFTDSGKTRRMMCGGVLKATKDIIFPFRYHKIVGAGSQSYA